MWCVAARFSTIGEAQSARSALDAAGIEARVGDENTIAVDWLYSNALGGVKLLVREEDRDDATELLTTAAEQQAFDAEPEVAAAPAAEEVRCPSCGSSDVHRVPRLTLFIVVSILAYGLGVAVGQTDLALAVIATAALIAAVTPSHRCSSCGERASLRDAPASPQAAPPPGPADTAERRCPRCGSAEVHRVPYRRLRSIPLLFSPAIVVIAPLWLFLPHWKCESCGARRPPV